MSEQDPIPYGYCHCGCGQKTTLHDRTNTRLGFRTGDPYRFLAGHSARGRRLRKGPDYAVDENGCWVWLRCINQHGYGMTSGGTAHRVYYEQHVGPVPKGLTLDHLCRNRACCNPEHLEPVTNLENIRRGRNTKLTADDVRAIRASSARGSDLARHYGVTQQAIHRIRKRLCWKDI